MNATEGHTNAELPVKTYFSTLWANALQTFYWCYQWVILTDGESKSRESVLSTCHEDKDDGNECWFSSYNSFNNDESYCD